MGIFDLRAKNWFLRTFLAGLILCALPLRAHAFKCPPGITDPRECIKLATKKQLADHSSTVGLEHSDRQSRLRRLSTGVVQPEFITDYLSPQEHGLAKYPISIPVLRVVFNNDVFFDTAQADIRPEAFPILKIISENLNREPSDVALFIVGHTDKRGDSDYNYNLGLRRADAVAEALARRGIYQANIYRLSLGEDSPRDSGNTHAANSRNRRVEFLFAATVEAATIWVKKIAVIPCIAKDKSDVNSCKREVIIDVKKVEVSLGRHKEIVALNIAEAAIVNDTTLSEAEINTQRQLIEIKRKRIPIKLDRNRTQVSILRGGVAAKTPIVISRRTKL